MGAYPSTYIGIYMIVPYGTEEEKESFFVHPETKRKMKTKYCPDTGAEGIKETRTKTVPKYPHAYIDEEGFDEDTFFSPEYDGTDSNHKTFILNTSKTQYTCDGFNDEESFNIDITTLGDANKLIEDFKKEFKKYIDYFEKEYGKVTIHYGVAHYYH